MSEYSRVVKSDSVWATAAVKVQDGKAYIIAIVKDAQGNPLPERKLVISKENCPAFLNTGKWLLSFNAPMTEVKYAKPMEGAFVCKFVDFAHEKDQAPAPKTRPNKFNPDKPQTIYTIIWEVAEGDYKGAHISFEIDYSYFVPQQIVWQDKPFTVVGIKMPKGDQSSRHAKASFGFDTALGLLDKPMKWADNILPGLLQRAKKATEEGKLALVKVEDGYGKSIQPVGQSTPNPDEFDLEGFDVPAAPSASNDFPVPVSEPDPFADELSESVAEQSADELPWEDADVPTVDGDGFPE